MARRLNLRERRFVNAYLGDCAGNATQAAIAAGYSKKSARVTASKLLTKANIRAAIAARLAKQESKGIADAEERDLEMSRILRSGTESGRIRAAHELNKVSGRHSIKHVLDASEKLSEIIAASRLPR